MTIEVSATFNIYGSRGQWVQVSAAPHQNGVNIRVYGVGRDDGITTFSEAHFANILTALLLGDTHIEGLPDFCQCKSCLDVRGKAFAEKIAAAQAERLAAATSGRFTCPNSEGHPFLACTDNAVICQVCGCHQGNHDK